MVIRKEVGAHAEKLRGSQASPTSPCFPTTIISFLCSGRARSQLDTSNLKHTANDPIKASLPLLIPQTLPLLQESQLLYHINHELLLLLFLVDLSAGSSSLGGLLSGGSLHGLSAVLGRVVVVQGGEGDGLFVLVVIHGEVDLVVCGSVGDGGGAEGGAVDRGEVAVDVGAVGGDALPESAVVEFGLARVESADDVVRAVFNALLVESDGGFCGEGRE